MTTAAHSIKNSARKKYAFNSILLRVNFYAYFIYHFILFD